MSYTHGHHESVLRSHQWRTAGNSAAYLLPHLQHGIRLLDVGCGPGTITVDLARIIGVEGEVVGIDTSADVIGVARDQAGTGPEAPQFSVGDIMHLDAPDGSFDVVHAHQVLQHLPDPVGALREMRRLTRPGGLVAARDADYQAMTWFPPHPELDAWQSVYRDAVRRNGGDLDAGRRLLSWSRQAGFEEIIPSASVWCFATPDDRQWWGGLWADRMTGSAVTEQILAASLADESGLQRMATAWREWAEAEDGWFAVLHGEVLCRVN